MTAFNPLTAILTQNKLEENPGDDAMDDEQKVYQKWVKADEMARCNILASMSNVLQYQHQSMESAYDILENLKEMFGDQNRGAKQTAMKALLNTKMVEVHRLGIMF
ncbi:uncharacterized protein LOC107761707 [Nicotiana tabacum]|uniref:Uncharacterized protein LOC107761707 n=1 Tax=Nicotiana tabacum TaxID=4097 RepID=A0AC58RMF0_TOBAC